MIDREALFQVVSRLGRQMPWSTELDLAVSAAEEAGGMLLGSFGRTTGQPKPDGSIVTEADLAADAFLSQRLNGAFPEDAVLSEEGRHGFDGQGRVWVVDPLDGSSNYMHGVPLWGVSLALVEGGRPVLGVSHFPCLRRTFWAVQGHGAFDGGRRMTAATSGTLATADLVTFCSRTPPRYELRVAATGRMLGSETLHLALVASGEVHASLAATSYLWDLAAGWLLVTESGGAIQTLDAGTIWPLAPGDYGSRTFATAAAGNELLLAEVLAGLTRRVPVPAPEASPDPA
jgi:myo-inositol-1(or 4)-monophosphatase